MDDVSAAARQLIDRYGEAAVVVARDRARKLELDKDWVAHRVALLVLNEVERMSMSK